MVSIIISESCCLLVYWFIIIIIIVIEEYRLAVSLSLFLVVLCLFYSLFLYQLSSYLNSVSHSFYLLSFHDSYFSRKHIFYESYRVNRTQDYGIKTCKWVPIYLILSQFWKHFYQWFPASLQPLNKQVVILLTKLSLISLGHYSEQNFEETTFL